jgi:hypothetical protein
MNPVRCGRIGSRWVEFLVAEKLTDLSKRLLEAEEEKGFNAEAQRSAGHAKSGEFVDPRLRGGCAV